MVVFRRRNRDIRFRNSILHNSFAVNLLPFFLAKMGGQLCDFSGGLGCLAGNRRYTPFMGHADSGCMTNFCQSPLLWRLQ